MFTKAGRGPLRRAEFVALLERLADAHEASKDSAALSPDAEARVRRFRVQLKKNAKAYARHQPKKNAKGSE